jgi:hypothetical protein
MKRVSTTFSLNEPKIIILQTSGHTGSSTYVHIMYVYTQQNVWRQFFKRTRLLLAL